MAGTTAGVGTRPAGGVEPCLGNEWESGRGARAVSKTEQSSQQISQPWYVSDKPQE